MKREAKKISTYSLKLETIEALKKGAVRLGEKRGTLVSASALIDELVHKHIILKLKGGTTK